MVIRFFAERAYCCLILNQPEKYGNILNMKLFDKHFYGDGQEQPLPSNRKRAFAVYGKEYFGKLITYSALCALFFLPALIWLFVMNYNKAQHLASLDASATDYAAEVQSYLKSFTLTTYGVLIPLIAIVFVGLAGCIYCVRKICFGKYPRIADFWRGLKENWLRYAIYGIAFGITYFVLKFNVVYFAQSNPIIYGLYVGSAMLLLLLVSIILMYCMLQAVTYTATNRQILKNALILTFAKFFSNAGVMLIAMLPLGLTLLIPSPFELLALLALTLFYVGYATLFITCYADYVFDKTINPRLGDEYVGRGLQPFQKQD